ncbi:phBC6A51 family helix-turn-helix protein [Priestia sp. OVS21]|nr:phBC6A51 family helix-turn-helix protein [Priestia sp. OVS21]
MIELATLKELKHNLTDQQALAAQLLVSNEFAGKERRSMDELAEEVGVTRVTLWGWKTKNVAFIKYMEALSEVSLASYKSLADAQLIKLIRGDAQANGLPSVKGLELFYKLSGRLVERSEVIKAETPEKRSYISDEDVQRGLDELNDLLQ